MTSVLVVDDEPAIVRTLSINLRARDYDVFVAGDGRTALDVCREEKPDVVLLDLGLPDLSGVEVLKQLRTWSQVPVVVLSARHGSDDKVDAWLRAGAGLEGYIGFAIGRSIFGEAVKAYAAGDDFDRGVAVDSIASKYQRFIDVYEGAHAPA